MVIEEASKLEEAIIGNAYVETNKTTIDLGGFLSSFSMVEIRVETPQKIARIDFLLY